MCYVIVLFFRCVETQPFFFFFFFGSNNNILFYFNAFPTSIQHTRDERIRRGEEFKKKKKMIAAVTWPQVVSIL